MTEAQNVLKRIKKIEIKTRRLVEGLMQGAYYSVFKGTGIEFSEVREYELGDDIRSIDWNVTARMSHPFVKEFVEERDLTVIVFFDISGSSEFGTQDLLKKEAAIELIASIVFSAIKNNDKVGLVLATDKVELYLPPRRGRRHALRLIREMLCCRPESRQTELGKPLVKLSKLMKKRGIVFIVSDFIDSMESIRKPIKMLKNRHDVIAIKVADIRERELPDVGYIDLEDSETGETITVDTADPAFRENFSRLAGQQRAQVREFMKRSKVDFIEIPASGDWKSPAVRFFRERSRAIA